MDFNPYCCVAFLQSNYARSFHPSGWLLHNKLNILAETKIPGGQRRGNPQNQKRSWTHNVWRISCYSACLMPSTCSWGFVANLERELLCGGPTSTRVVRLVCPPKFATFLCVMWSLQGVVCTVVSRWGARWSRPRVCFFYPMHTTMKLQAEPNCRYKKVILIWRYNNVLRKLSRLGSKLLNNNIIDYRLHLYLSHVMLMVRATCTLVNLNHVELNISILLDVNIWCLCWLG